MNTLGQNATLSEIVKYAPETLTTDDYEAIIERLEQLEQIENALKLDADDIEEAFDQLNKQIEEYDELRNERDSLLDKVSELEDRIWELES